MTGTTRIEREPIRPVARNRRARHEYDILDTFEAGLELKGAEVKSVRAGQVSLQDAYARVEDGEAWLLGARIAAVRVLERLRSRGSRPAAEAPPPPQADRRAPGTGRAAVADARPPLGVLQSRTCQGRAPLARGRRMYDKRRAIAEREAGREAERAMKGMRD